MPAALPALAGFGAVSLWGTAGFTLGAIATNVAIGALAGAVVGGLTAAISGGDLGEGILYGVVGGAVGGALGGFNVFGNLASPVGAMTEGATGAALGAVPSTSANMSAADFMVGGGNMFGAGGSTGTGVVTGAETAAGAFGMKDAMMLSLAQGGVGMAGSMLSKGGETYDKSKEAQDAYLAQRDRERESQERIAMAGLSQRDQEAQLQAQLSRESLAQRKFEATNPYAEQEKARDRMRETATGLTLARKQQEALQKTKVPTALEQEAQDYING